MAHHESSGSPLLALISHPPFTHTHSSSHSSSHSQSHSRSFSSASASEPVPASAPTPAVRSFSGGYTSTGTQKFSTAISGPSPSRSVSASLTHLQPGQHHYTSHVHTSPQHRHPQNLSQNSHPAYADSNNSLQQPLLHYQRSRSRSPRPHSPLRYQQTSSSSSLDISTNNCHTKTASTSNSTHTRHLSLHNNYSTYSPSHNRGYGHASSSSASLPQYNSGYGYGFSSANTASSTTGTLSSRKMGAHSHSPSQLREVTPITIDDFSSANTSQLSLSTSASGFDKMGAHGHKHRGHGPEKISGDFVDDHGSSHDDTHKNEGGHGNSCSHDHGHNHKHDHGHDHHHHDHHHHDHKHGHDHDHDHVHFHAHAHSSMDDKSRVTKFLLGYTSSYPFLNAIMIEKDSRRILYYMLLNISFMMVQAFYGYVTDSLGLLSDTVHMFFDCMALLVGLVASVLGKRPPSQRFPYGLGKIETLSGFANGILLVLLSVEITFEAFERIWEGTETKRLGELLAVSVMGMVVNLVGMFAFGHHHHGHSHGGHDHSHGDGGCGGHDNENMQGIYLHVLADTLGSASVVVSTLLTYFTGHSFWDQLASVFISVLILGSSKPLIMSAARRLLLGIPDNIEYNLRNTLSGIAQQRGVLAYSVPKFWMDDRLGRENRLLGFVHVVAVKGASLEDVRDRVQNYLSQHNMDIVVQVEREGDASCWCDIGRAASGLALANASSL